MFSSSIRGLALSVEASYNEHPTGRKGPSMRAATTIVIALSLLVSCDDGERQEPVTVVDGFDDIDAALDTEVSQTDTADTTPPEVPVTTPPLPWPCGPDADIGDIRWRRVGAHGRPAIATDGTIYVPTRDDTGAHGVAAL